MSTRCYIGKLINGNKLKFVYCHHDGYINGVGKILFENYNDTKIDDLLENGDMSSLGKTIEDCDFYKDDNSTAATINLAEFLELDKINVDYVYIYGSNHWVVCDYRNQNFKCTQLDDFFKGEKNE